MSNVHSLSQRKALKDSLDEKNDMVLGCLILWARVLEIMHTGDHARHCNYIYGEGTKHGSNDVASMMHYFFMTMGTAIGSTKMLHLHRESYMEPDTNNGFLGYCSTLEN